MTERLTINPDVLIWRREGLNATHEDLAKCAGTTVERVKQWEAGELGPTANQLENVAKRLLTSMAYFFAEEVPSDDLKPIVSFPKLFGSKHELPSFELLRQVERARARRDDMWTLLVAEDREPSNFSLSVELGDVSKAVQRIREWAHVSENAFTPSDSSKTHVLNDWIDAIETAGVAIFHVENVSIEELRGLAIKDERMPIILLNPKDLQRPRTFTLLHELTHLALGDHDWSEGSLTADQVTGESDAVERFCKRVAAELMMPKTAVSEFVRSELGRTPESPLHSERLIKRVANSFCSSYSMATIRLQNLDLVDAEVAEKILGVLRATAGSKRSSGGNFYASNLQRVGRGYTRAVLDAYQSGLISYASAGEKLNSRKRDGVERMRASL